MIRSETNEKRDLEGHYPQNPISHCIIFDHIALFQSRISAIPEIKADLFLDISKTGMCLLTVSFYYFGSQLAKVGKKWILVLF